MRPYRIPLAVAMTGLLLGCAPSPPREANAAATAETRESIGAPPFERRAMPDEDPGPPLYTRATGLGNQFLQDGEWLAIPFYRDPQCVPSEFNLLQHFHLPDAAGPGAFACPMTATGWYLIEPDAPQGTFPRLAVLQGQAVPIWFVRWREFQEEAAGGSVTMAALRAMSPRRGTATVFHETLLPRPDEHLVAIVSAGRLEDGGSFELLVTHVENEVRHMELQLR